MSAGFVSRRALVLAALAGLLAGCQGMGGIAGSSRGMGGAPAGMSGMAGGTAPASTASLYQRLGGLPAITAVVDDMVANVAADNRINRFFAKTDIGRLKRMLVAQVCQATGGACQYTGDDMKTVHEGMHITDADFDALVQDLVKSLDLHHVPAAEQQQLLAILGPMRPDIVGH